MAGGVCWYVFEPERDVRGGSCQLKRILEKIQSATFRYELTFGAAPVFILLVVIGDG